MTAPTPERHPDRSTRTEEAMSEPAARKRLREAREQAKAERAEAVYDVRLTHRSLPDRAEHLAEELRKALVHNGAVPSVVRLQGAAVMVGLQMLAGDLAICERRAREVEAERDRVKAELDARIGAESADAAAGSYAGRAEEAEAEVERLRAANKTNADEYDAALLAIHEARDHWQERAVAESERAEKAEAALAGMRERLGNAEVEWAARWREPNGEEVYRSSDTEADARHFVRLWRERGLPGYVTGLEVVSALIGEWQSAETPRTALERAADEQGDGEGGGA